MPCWALSKTPARAAQVETRGGVVTMPSGARPRDLIRRVVGLTATLGLLTAAVAFYRVAPGLPTTPVAPAPTTTPAVGPASLSPTPTPSPAASESGSLEGPGITEPGIFVLATPGSDGSFDVAEMVRLAVPVTVLTLRPPAVAQAGRDFARAEPHADQVQVSAGSQPVMVPDGRVASVQTVAVSGSVREFELRYQLSGVTVRSVPSTAGRALAALAPLTTGVPADLPVMVAVNGRTVRNLQCPRLRLSEQSCATGTLPQLRINRALPRRTAVVVVQLDLPRPQ